MANLPTSGDTDWGTTLNTFLGMGHDSDGTHTKAKMLTDMEWSPTSYAGEESVTLPNGLIIKTGTKSIGANSSETVTFGAAFDTLITIIHSLEWSGASGGNSGNLYTTAKSSSAFTALNSADSAATMHWMAIGY